MSIHCICIALHLSLFVHSYDPLSSIGLSYSCDNGDSMFVHSYDPLSSEYFRVTEMSQIYCSFFIVLCSCGLLLSVVIYCFRNFVNRYTKKLPFLPWNWVRLVTMGIHCLFILTTLSLPSGWVRLVTMGIHCLFILTTLSLPSGWVRLVMMGIHCLFILMTLSLPSGWLRLVTMGIHCLFILTSLSLPPGWVRLVTLGILFLFILIWPSLFHLVELGISWFALRTLLPLWPSIQLSIKFPFSFNVNGRTSMSLGGRCLTVCPIMVTFWILIKWKNICSVEKFIHLDQFNC